MQIMHAKKARKTMAIRTYAGGDVTQVVRCERVREKVSHGYYFATNKYLA